MSETNNENIFEFYVITEDQMRQANTYIPLLAKEALIELIAEHCLSKMDISATIDGDNIMAMPPMYKENTQYKSRFLMGVFTKLYLRFTWELDEPDDPKLKELTEDARWTSWLLPIDEYDKWAGGHVFGQIEQFKRIADIKDICFNILADYKDFERRLNSEIYSKLTALNDPAARTILGTQAQLSPDKMEEALEQLEQAKEALEAYQNAKNNEETLEEGTK